MRRFFMKKKEKKWKEDIEKNVFVPVSVFEKKEFKNLSIYPYTWLITD